MANDKAVVWAQTIRLGRPPANGELLVGDGSDFNLTTLTAGANVAITNTAGGISIASSNPGGTVTDVTATAPLASSGGTAPDISLTGTIDIANGGTGLTTLTANNVILGNGTSAPQFVAPGTSGNILTSNGTTWTSATPVQNWTLLVKASNQNLTTSSTSFQDVSGLTFSVTNGKSYTCRASIRASSPASPAAGSNGGGIKISATGPSFSSLFLQNTATGVAPAWDGTITSFNAQSYEAYIALNVEFSFTASAGGTLAMRAAQNSSQAGTTVIYAGSWLEYREIS